MVARTAAEPQGRPNKFTDVGVVGRYIDSDNGTLMALGKQD
jgi:hypothetical protein